MSASPASAEWNPVATHPVEIGQQADRLIVGFKATADNATVKMVTRHSRARAFTVRQAQTSPADVASLAHRTALQMSGSRQLTPSMHLLLLPKMLYGADVDAALASLRADPAVAFADIDKRRFPHSVPNDPLFLPSPTAAEPASGQWYLDTPSAAMITLGGTATQDLSAIDAVSAWGITQGSSGTVIADVDTGIRFDHPDLLRAGFGGRLLPGYDFVGEDYNSNTGVALGTYLKANDGDGYDPDPSDPGDWISSTDQQNTALFPSADCAAENSSWHGTRVVGVMGALTNNDTGIAGTSWNPYILPVRALGKCGGYDSDILTAVQWAVGISVTGVPDNPYPADIINLSLGGTGSCSSDYQSVLDTLNHMGVLVVASAGNASGAVESPGNCTGVLAVAGLRNVGTKVGYSSFGAEVGVSAPAGNCVNSSGACLRSIDTTSNDGLTTPGDSSYTNETNYNLGTSFSAPIVSGVAALMLAVNANLTPAQIIARIESSATPFPANTGNLPVCPNLDGSSDECSCPASGQCGTGMINAFSAVKAAQNPIAAVTLPVGFTTGSATLDASGSVAACGATIASYAWSATGSVHIVSGASSAQVNVNSTGAGVLILTVTDSAGNSDSATIEFTGSGATTSAPASAGSSASACVTSMTVTPAAPLITQAFSPASVSANVASTLTVTLTNNNGFALTQSALTLTLPANLTIPSGQTPSTTCTGASLSLTNTTGSVTLASANIPASGDCEIVFNVTSATAGTYVSTLGIDALITGPAGGNTAAASASLTVTAPSGGGGGGGSLSWWDVLLLTLLLLAGRGFSAVASNQRRRY
jgi:serine protease